MDIINADVTELLQSWKNMQTAITSIETTKASILRKHQQLSNEWRDKKYKELGEVIQECNIALNDILKVLTKGEKFISTLAKSLQEYENVNIEGNYSADNSFVQGLRSVAYSVGGNNTYQYCLGVLTRGTVSESYIGIISSRHDKAETKVRRVFDNFTHKLLIQNADYPPNEIAHYSPMNYEGHRRGVYYNATSDMHNRRGAGTTYYHELAHMIDHAATGFQGNISNTSEFAEALMNDGQRVLDAFNQASDEGQRRFINNLRSNDRTHSFQDLLDATTNGQISVGWGHEREYWRHSGNLQAEAFAHFFEASMGAEDKLQRFELYFPTAFAIFSTMIENIVPSEYIRVLERSR